MAEFAGWEMPLHYPGGTLHEHRSCRGGAAVFDVSHLGSLVVSGADAGAGLQSTFSNDLSRIGPGRTQYTHLLDPDDGSVLDDVIVWWVKPDLLHVLPNAANADVVAGALAGAGLVPSDTGGERVLIAVQGPRARQILATVAFEAASVERGRVARFDWQGTPGIAAGTGYTGEDGVECYVAAEAADGFWAALVGGGAVAAGLGARDTLRLEAGYPLWGHELGPGITPLQAGMEWVVGWDKGPFPGRAPLEAEKARGVARRLRGMVVGGPRPPRAGYPIRLDGAVIGEVTSGNLSPILGLGIALGLLPSHLEYGDAVEVIGRHGPMPAQLVRTPFVARPR